MCETTETTIVFTCPKEMNQDRLNYLINKCKHIINKTSDTVTEEFVDLDAEGPMKAQIKFVVTCPTVNLDRPYEHKHGLGVFSS